MKKDLQILLSVLIALMLALGCALSEGAGEKSVPASPAEAEEFVRVLLGDDPAALDGRVMMTPQMEAAIFGAGGFAALAAQLRLLGAAEEIGPAYETVLGGMKTWRVPCRFALMPLDIALTLDGDALAGLTTQPFTGNSVKAQAEESFLSVPLALPVPGLGELPGTLTLPKDGGPFPAVVLIHGSGPSDRDETTGSLTPFRDIAVSLTEKGIAVYRFDKRTLVYGNEIAGDTGFTLMEENVLDAAEAVRLLSQREDIDRERIFVLGHSLGASAIPAIDGVLNEEGLTARGYILMAPAARRLDTVMRDQYLFLAEAFPASAGKLQAALAELGRLESLDSLAEDEKVAGAFPAYWRWLFSYDVLTSAEGIKAPCLLLQGEEDYQVTMEDFELFRGRLGGRDNWTFVSFPSLTHLFVPGRKADGPNAYAADQRMDAGVLECIADFILSK